MYPRSKIICIWGKYRDLAYFYKSKNNDIIIIDDELKDELKKQILVVKKSQDKISECMEKRTFTNKLDLKYLKTESEENR